MKDFYKKFTETFRSIEKKLLVVLILALVFVTFTQVILRTVLKVGIPAFDMVINYLVLWIAMISSGIIVYDGHHIKIDLLSKFAKGKLQVFIKFLISFFGGMTSLLFFLIFFNYCFVIEFYKPFYLNKFASVNLLQYLSNFKFTFLMILPLGFLIIGIRFLNKMLIYAFHVFSKIVRFFNAYFGLFYHGIVIYISSIILINKYNILNKYFIISLLCYSSIMFVIIIVILIIEKVRSNPKILHLLYLPNILFYILIFFVSLSFIASLTIKSKILNELIIFNQVGLNLLYSVPLLTLFIIHYTLMHPYIDIIKNYYKEEEEAV